MNEQQNHIIDFDIDISDQNKLTFLVKNTLEHKSYKNRKYDCDCFDVKECHHGISHTFENKLTDKCSYCSFIDYLVDKNSSFRINEKHKLFVKYKKGSNYKQELIDWCEFQPKRTPYAILAFASCKTKLDLLNSLKTYENIKQEYKNCTISFKFFIDISIENAIIDELNIHDKIFSKASQNRLAFKRQVSSYSLSTTSLPVGFSTTFDLQEDSSLTTSLPLNEQTDSGVDLESITKESNLKNADFKPFNDKLIDPKNLIDNLEEAKLNKINSSSSFDKKDSLDTNDEIELNQKLRAFENEIVYFDFSLTNNDNTDDMNLENTVKIEACLQDSVNIIFKQLFNLTKSINPNEDSQVNFYSEFLRIPFEKDTTGNRKSNSLNRSANNNLSFLTMKMVNKKKTAARINKYIGDIALCLNLIDLAIYHYSHAYSISKKDREKENDYLWAYSALEGLCIASHFYYVENNKSESMIQSVSNDVVKNKAVKELSKSLKKAFSNSSKDISLLTISYGEFPKYFDEIIRGYDRNDSTKFLAFESTLMIIKFFIKNNFRQDAINFLIFTIYINLQIKEEFRIRRYSEIGKLYDLVNLKRLATFYKWISVVRVFKLIDKNLKYAVDLNLKCLVSKCSYELKNSFEVMKIDPQKTPLNQINYSSIIKDKGFPLSKIHIVGQLVQLTSHNSKFDECIKHCKYLIHEFEPYLTQEDFSYFLDFYYNLLDKTSTANIGDDTEFFKKFYKFPQLTVLQILSPSLEMNRMIKIKEEQTKDKSIYIHRYKNPLLAGRKKTVYNLRVNELNKIEMTFYNPSSIELNIDYIDLIIQNQDLNSENLNLKIYTNYDLNVRSFKVNSKNSEKFLFHFKYDCVESIKIIGYEIYTLKCVNRILFEELVQSEKSLMNNLKQNTNKNLIMSHYDVEMIPKLPLITDLRIFYKKNNNDMIYSNYLSQSKSLTISCKLGSSHILNLDYLTDDDTNLEIIEFNFTIMNEKLLDESKLNTKIETIRNENDKFSIKVDSSQFFSDNLLDETDLDLNCFLEIKYTNNRGKETNLCHVLRFQVLIKFVQPIYLSITEFKDINDEHFEVYYKVRNLVDEPCNLLHENEKKCIDNRSELTLKTILDKFSLDKSINDLLKLLNEKICLYRYENNENSDNEIKPVLDKILLSKFNQLTLNKNTIFKCPVSFDLNLSVINKGDLDEQLFMHQIILSGNLNVQDLKLDLESSFFTVKIKNKLTYPNIVKWNLKDLANDNKWVHQFNLISNKDFSSEYVKTQTTDDNILIQISLNNIIDDNLSESVKWDYKFSLLTRKFEYLI